MLPVRTFLGWSRPALEQAAEWLLERYAAPATADMSRTIVALPGARAGRRLLEILVEQAEERRLALTPPQITTGGQLPEKLYEPEGHLADELTCRLAWLRALEETDAELLRRIVPELPDRKDPSRWLGLAELVHRLHDELAGHGLTFAEVAERGFGQAGDPGSSSAHAVERGRWQTLAAVQNAYVNRLSVLGLLDTQWARLCAVQAGACRSERDIVLVGVADLPVVIEQMLELLGERVTALVYAPEELANRFTKLGVIVTSAWRSAHIHIDERQLVVAEGPADQATAVADLLAGFEGRFGADEITIGVPDASVAPYLERRFEQFDLPSRYAEALRVKQTGPYRLLSAMADYLDGERFGDFAALVRHPDVEAWLARRLPAAGDVGQAFQPDAGSEGENVRLDNRTYAGNWLTALDRWYNQHLQARLGGTSLERSGAARQVAAVEKKIAELTKALQGQHMLAEWAAEIAALIVAVYGWRQLDRNHTQGRVILEACDAIHGVLRQAFTSDAKLSGRWSAPDAIRLLLRQIEDKPIPPPAGHSAIELLGWLELPLDDAPALIVTGFNDSFVPSFINADPFLPNGLRRQLGLVDNDQRYARDAYALSVLLGSREKLVLIAGRRSAEGDPLSPSRLAFACPREQIAGRVLGYFGISPTAVEKVPHGLPPGVSSSRFAPPRPRKQEQPLTSLRVTQFRDFLACPYRFYLRHVERLAPLCDLAEELDPLAFGSLAHDVLKTFGEVPDNSRLTEPEKIKDLLDAELDRLVLGHYGKERLPAVELQVEQLRLRLAAFARWQADWASQGWRIIKTEVEVEDGVAPFNVDGEPIFLRARIDRIDVHESDGRYIIFDYKTSEKGDGPNTTHRRKNGEWIDLQLPLYRHLAGAVSISGDNVGLGYILLPKSLSAVKDELAPWEQTDLESADETAREVVRKIRGQEFWPPASPGPSFDDFAAICLQVDNRLL
ncbi:MAG TPA: PD-(D/E)XK nuclease family protein [Pirellulales bacterium]|nr:PD-(D/E)XK nuclease family protein [Pirellulales bacterium]